MIWENAPLPDWQFWELEAELRGDQFVVVKAEDPFEPPPKATHFGQPLPKGTVKEQPAATPQVPLVKPAAPSLTMKEIRAMAIPAKIQLTCKLSPITRSILEPP
ncbi:MAG: hypothetical protein WCD18_19430 [Thermosynechococcaceae cyanobacterium]